MISYDVIGDYMSDLDDVRKRIEKRKRPLNDHNFKKLYNGMVRLMVMMIVVASPAGGSCSRAPPAR